MNLKQAKALRGIIIQAVRNGALDPRDIYQTKTETMKIDGEIVEYPGQTKLVDWCAKGAYRRAKRAFRNAARYGAHSHHAAMAELANSVDAYKARQDLHKRKPL